MYPVNPVRPENVGVRGDLGAGSEIRQQRSLVVGTKVTGPMPAVREARLLNGPTIRQTVEASLRRLKRTG